MQLTKNKFDAKKVEELLTKENKFIMDLFSVAAIPDRIDFSDVNDDETQPETKINTHVKKTSRAKSLQELQQRLQAIRTKKKLTYKEKLAKKGLKNRMKKKNKQDERNAKQKIIRAAKLTSKTEIKSSKKKKKKGRKTQKKLLKQLEERKDRIQKLEESGELEKAIEIKEKAAWKRGISESCGKRKWENRLQGVQKVKDEKQQKRKENIDKRKKDKKVKKLKKASKKGRIIPGF
ncbi:hypothetical protein NQ317_006721 [Molorchus minor]|uniref:Ribosomal RNA-processing protein 14/surfeit locus protein 6 C-terminal domain-containing protein n=1 Tax=Molorchus minor TaxID=1323400 RepID=A0ABQ9K2W9_9CUCU|nr:hypothetical protein NQ317_006721 [Molorchus minor]